LRIIRPLSDASSQVLDPFGMTAFAASHDAHAHDVAQ
jgi:hypothetical protein